MNNIDRKSVLFLLKKSFAQTKLKVLSVISVSKDTFDIRATKSPLVVTIYLDFDNGWVYNESTSKETEWK